MDLKTLKERIEALDPVLHGALRRALLAEYERRAGQATIEPFEEVFRRAASNIAERYVVGTDDHVREHHPDLYRRTEEADRRMNETWVAGRQRKATIEEFRQAVEEWEALHLEGVALFAKRQACQGAQRGYQTKE